MIKVNWDVEELVALIDVYRRSDEKSAEQIEVELLALSKAFVERAERLGIEHDEKYRNLNGMKMMFQNVAYVASNGDHGMSAASSAMRKVYDMSNSSPEGYTLNPNKMYFEILEDGKVVKATMTDEKIVVEVPKTGMNDFKLIYILGTIFIIVGVGILIYVKEKRRK